MVYYNTEALLLFIYTFNIYTLGHSLMFFIKSCKLLEFTLIAIVLFASYHIFPTRYCLQCMCLSPISSDWLPQSQTVFIIHCKDEKSSIYVPQIGYIPHNYMRTYLLIAKQILRPERALGIFSPAPLLREFHQLLVANWPISDFNKKNISKHIFNLNYF